MNSAMFSLLGYKPKVFDPNDFTEGAYAIASSEFGGTAQGAIDNVLLASANCWASDLLTPPQWLQIDLQGFAVFNWYRFAPYSNYHPVAWTLEASNAIDGSNELVAPVTLDTRTGQDLTVYSYAWAPAYTFVNAVAYRFVRFTFIDSITHSQPPGDKYVSLLELEIKYV